MNELEKTTAETTEVVANSAPWKPRRLKLLKLRRR
jgi:hypothetical protein